MVQDSFHSSGSTSASPSIPSPPLCNPPHRSNAAPKWDNCRDEWLSDEPELESDFHRDQIDLLLRLMRWHWRERNDIYFSGNTTVYYDPDQRTNRNFRGPDIYVVFGAEKRLRNSWMVWREGDKYPDVVFELLSNSTAKTDRTTKKELYQNQWKLSNYFWFHPETKEFQGFILANGQYQEIQPNDQGHLWSDPMQLFVGVHDDGMLRLFTSTGELILLEEEEERSLKEAAQQQEQIALQREQMALQREQTALQREQIALQRAEQLAARLRQMGLDPEDF
ncbi:MAG: Uma2 family endonuclease [Merismopedia sp. SIO2A8]|nr:Uma2 family endonuclease [Merismopedia sp. SIO2A8]